jgi:protein required for attachment to host cells
MAATRTFVLIADAAHARAYLSLSPGQPLRPVAGFDMAEHIPPAREVHRHEPASSHPGVGTAHHAVGPVSDPRREMKRHFAERVAAALARAHADGAFDRLVIAAPPAMLGDLRKLLAPKVAACIVAELGKDLVKTPEHELPAHFADVMAL